MVMVMWLQEQELLQYHELFCEVAVAVSVSDLETRASSRIAAAGAA